MPGKDTAPCSSGARRTRPMTARPSLRVGGARLAGVCVAISMLASVLAFAAPASAGEIVYQHGPDLWVMNENGSNQRPLITAAQIGAGNLAGPSLDPSSGDLSFQGAVLSNGVCSDNCPGLYSYVGGSVVRLSAAPFDCINAVDFGCGSDQGGPNVTTSNGRVIYLSSFFVDNLSSDIAGQNFYDRALNGSGEQALWVYPNQAEVPTGEAGEGLDAVDPVEPNTIAYGSSAYCSEKIENDTKCEEGILIDQDGAAEPSYVVSYDDTYQQAMAFSPDGRYIADIEAGEERGIWIYTNENVEDKSTWHGWWLLKDPLENNNSGVDEHTFQGLTVTNSGEIVFDNGINIYALPASCWSAGKGFSLPPTESVEPTCGTFGQPDSQAVQLTSDGTTSSRDEHPTWTSAALSSYVVPGSPPAPPSTGSPASTTPTTPAPSDDVSTLALGTSSTVAAGKPLTFKVTLKAASTIKVQILRYVAASGHGRHRVKAHYVLVETLTFTGKVGLNKLTIPTKHNGRKLPAGRYEARFSAGAGSHTIAFTIKH